MAHIELNGRLILSGCLVINDKKEVLLLFRTKHRHYETPGGKVNPAECKNPPNPSEEDLAKTAERETYEELGKGIKLGKLKYFGKTEFTIPDGRLAVANKFLTRIILGKPVLAEPELFSEIKWLPLEKLEQYPVSPDLKLLAPRLKEYAKTMN